MAIIALDTCTESDGTNFGGTKPNTPPFPHTPDLGFGGWIVDYTQSGYLTIQSNKLEQGTGHLGGRGGKYCAADVAHDNFTYFADIDPAADGFPGLGFRANENPEDGGGDGRFWQQNADAFYVRVQSSTGQLNLSKRVAGAQAGLLIATGVSVPLRLVLVVSGSNLDVYSEPIGGGTRTEIVLGVDLGQDFGGSTDLFNDTDHMRFTLEGGSNLEIGTTWDNITVELFVLPTGQVQFGASIETTPIRSKLDQFSPGVHFDGLNPRFYRGSSFQRRDS